LAISPKNKRITAHRKGAPAGPAEEGNPPGNGGYGAGRVPSRLVQVLGWLCVFASAFCFYLATTVIRWAKAETTLEPSVFVLARFLIGFAVICIIMILRRKGPQPRRYNLLLGRAVFNFMAVYFFYKAVAVTSVAEGNILNMTYPVFIALFSWIFMRKQRDPLGVAMVALAFAGIWLILTPGDFRFRTESLWGLASGVTAAFAILSLNLSRQYHDSETVLFYMFGLGAVITYPIFYHEIILPDATGFYYLGLCSLYGVGGQYLLTLGFRYVTAVEGGIISSTRILLAALLGPVMAADPPLTAAGWVGAVLLFVANVVLAGRRVRG